MTYPAFAWLSADFVSLGGNLVLPKADFVTRAVGHSLWRRATVATLQRGECRLRKPSCGLRHAEGSLRRTEGGEAGIRTLDTKIV